MKRFFAFIITVIMFSNQLVRAEVNNIEKWLSEESGYEIITRFYDDDYIEKHKDKWAEEVKPTHMEFLKLLDILESNKGSNDFKNSGLSGLPNNYLERSKKLIERAEELRSAKDNYSPENPYISIAFNSVHDLHWLSRYYIEHGAIDIENGKIPNEEEIKPRIKRIFEFKKINEKWEDDSINPAMRDINPFGLRMPAELKEVLEKSAEKNKRSLNSEILIRLEQSIE